MAQRLIVIGGDAAGMSAASAARRQLPQDQLEIVAFERGHYTSYSACGIPYFIGKDVADTTELIARTPQQFRDHHAIDARTGHEVLEIDLHRRAVLVRDLVRDFLAQHNFDVDAVADGQGGNGLVIALNRPISRVMLQAEFAEGWRYVPLLMLVAGLWLVSRRLRLRRQAP